MCSIKKPDGKVNTHQVSFIIGRWTQYQIDILGWTGSVLYLLAYALVSLKKTEGDSLLYQGMNIVAGIVVVIYSLYLQAYATTGLNVVWIAIGLFTLGRKWLTRN